MCSYDSYLDAFMSASDLVYLDSSETARQLAEHKCAHAVCIFCHLQATRAPMSQACISRRPPEQCLAVTRTAFDASRNLAEQEAAAAARRNRMVSEGCDVSKSPLLKVPDALTMTRVITYMRQACTLEPGVSAFQQTPTLESCVHIQRYLQCLTPTRNYYSATVCVQALADREPRVRSGALATIIFLRAVKGKHELSAFIDYKARCVQLGCS